MTLTTRKSDSEQARKLNNSSWR